MDRRIPRCDSVDTVERNSGKSELMNKYEPANKWMYKVRWGRAENEEYVGYKCIHR